MASALEPLGELGDDARTMDAVAARAHASKDTMYRRWRSKAELVKAALDSLDAGGLRSDLVAVMEAMREKATPSYVAMLQGLAVAARHDAALAASLRSHVEDAELSPFQGVLRRAVERQRLPADAPTDLVHDVAEAMILRQVQTGSPFDGAFICRVVDDVLLPLLCDERGRK